MNRRERRLVIVVAAISGIAACAALVLAVTDAARGHDPTHAVVSAIVAGAVGVIAAAAADSSTR